MLFGYIDIFLSVLQITGYEWLVWFGTFWFDIDFWVFGDELVLLANMWNRKK